MSQPTTPDQTPEKDDDEFAALLGTVSSKLDQRTDSIRDAQELAKKHKDDPELALVQAGLADIRAGRVNPRNSPLWATNEVN